MGGKVYEWHSYQIGPEEQLGLTRLQINFSPTEMVETSDEQIFLRGIRYLRKHHQESYVVDEVKASPTENWEAEEGNDDRYKQRLKKKLPYKATITSILNTLQQPTWLH